jgi:hypothetical protein
MQRTLKEEAMGYEPKQIKNISELDSVPTELEIFEELNAEYPYKYIVVDNEKYKVPLSVLFSLKAIFDENPNLKTFKVKKTGDGMNTKYTVIPLS